MQPSAKLRRGLSAQRSTASRSSRARGTSPASPSASTARSSARSPSSSVGGDPRRQQQMIDAGGQPAVCDLVGATVGQLGGELIVGPVARRRPDEPATPGRRSAAPARDADPRRPLGERSSYTAARVSGWTNRISAGNRPGTSTSTPAASTSSSGSRELSSPAAASARSARQRGPETAAAAARSRAAGVSVARRASTVAANECGAGSGPCSEFSDCAGSSSTSARIYSGWPSVCSRSRSAAARLSGVETSDPTSDRTSCSSRPAEPDPARPLTVVEEPRPAGTTALIASRPGRDQGTDPIGVQPPQRKQQRRGRGRIDPVRVVEHQQHRAAVLQRTEQRQQLRADGERVRRRRRRRRSWRRSRSPAPARARSAGRRHRDRARSRTPPHLLRARRSHPRALWHRRRNAVLPIPASPSTTTSCGRASRAATSASATSASSACRPTNSVRPSFNAPPVTDTR